jgi:hypothetical protein
MEQVAKSFYEQQLIIKADKVKDFFQKFYFFLFEFQHQIRFVKLQHGNECRKIYIVLPLHNTFLSTLDEQ